MLTKEGLKALIEFSDKTKAVIVTRAMSDSDQDQLNKMLLDWKAQPTKQKEHAIIIKFAIAREQGSEPGPDY
jgi:hypothetical protein